MNLKPFIYLFLSQLVLLALAYSFCQRTNRLVIAAKRSVSQTVAGEISKARAARHVDYSLLDSLTQGKKIILLGEQQHGDGTTQQLYSELALHLFEKGFNTLYLETAFYKTQRFWEELKSGTVKDFSTSGIYPFWRKSTQTQSLRDTIVNLSSSPYPLCLKGLDFQISIVFAQNDIYSDLMSYMKTIPDFVQGDFKQIRHSLTNRFGPVLYFNSKGDRMDNNRKACLAELIKMQKLIDAKTGKTAKDSIYRQYIHNIYHFYYAKMYLHGDEYNNYRDSMMFENLIWQMNKSGIQKAIVWTANAHAGNDTEGWIRLGARIKDNYRDSVLTIMTTCYSGYTTNISSGKVQRINPATVVTVENFLKEEIDDIVLFDVPEKIKSQKVEMRFYGHKNIESEWFKKFDAFFFIKNMKPSEY